MKYLLDTNVVSEWVRPRPDPGVVAWLAAADEDSLHLSVIALAELRHGVERLTPGRRRLKLARWLTRDLPARFEGRILPIDGLIADVWGVIVARREAEGRPIGSMDAFLAATAQVHDLVVVSRNIADFRNTAQVISPWQG